MLPKAQPSRPQTPYRDPRGEFGEAVDRVQPPHHFPNVGRASGEHSRYDCHKYGIADVAAK
jgi:hypothetical protein